MDYIIDGNNLAGKLKMLGDKNFDKKLIRTIEDFNREKANKIILVFDGNEPYGDKIEAGENVTVIYSPKDKYYQSADDKIVEIVNNYLNSKQVILRVVTGDRDLIKRVKKLSEDLDKEVEILSATAFSGKLKSKDKNEDDNKDDDDRKLSSKQMSDINNEMLNLWK